jgi:two-component system, cell cycle response regulator DivK
VSVVPNRPIVLLVEDDREGRQLYAEWLEQAGFRVEQAHNGLQALERAFDLRPDVVVTDLNIPGIDGYELTRRLKADRRTSATPIVAVTGYGPFTQDPSRADRAGCDMVLSKPCGPEDLEAAIRGLIDRHASESSIPDH